MATDWQSWGCSSAHVLCLISHLPCCAPSPTSLPPTHVEVAVHVEAHNAKVVGSGNIRDDALSASALFRHPHPHVPVPELGPWKILKVKTFHAGRGPQPTHPTLPGHLFRRRPFGLKLLLIQRLPEHPAQPRHGLHTVQQCWVLGSVFIPLGIGAHDGRH